MSETTDQRIQRILQKKAEEEEAAQQLKKQADEQAKKQHATAKQVKKKWTADTQVIAEILEDFEQKLSPLDLQLKFQDAGQPASTIAAGRVVGRISGRELHIVLNIHPNGDIHAFSEGPKFGHVHVQFASPLKLSALTADRDQYEALILDFIEKNS